MTLCTSNRLLQVGWDPADFHTVGLFGSIPKPAIEMQSTALLAMPDTMTMVLIGPAGVHQLSRMGQCSAEPHELGSPGATPGSATAQA